MESAAVRLEKLQARCLEIKQKRNQEDAELIQSADVEVADLRRSAERHIDALEALIVNKRAEVEEACQSLQAFLKERQAELKELRDVEDATHKNEMWQLMGEAYDEKLQHGAKSGLKSPAVVQKDASSSSSSDYDSVTHATGTSDTSTSTKCYRSNESVVTPQKECHAQEPGSTAAFLETLKQSSERDIQPARVFATPSPTPNAAHLVDNPGSEEFDHREHLEMFDPELKKEDDSSSLPVTMSSPVLNNEIYPPVTHISKPMATPRNSSQSRTPGSPVGVEDSASSSTKKTELTTRPKREMWGKVTSEENSNITNSWFQSIRPIKTPKAHGSTSIARTTPSSSAGRSNKRTQGSLRSSISPDRQLIPTKKIRVGTSSEKGYVRRTSMKSQASSSQQSDSSEVARPHQSTTPYQASTLSSSAELFQFSLDSSRQGGRSLETVRKTPSNRVTEYGSPVRKEDSIVVQHPSETTVFEITEIYATRAAGNSRWAARERLELRLNADGHTFRAKGNRQHISHFGIHKEKSDNRGWEEFTPGRVWCFKYHAGCNIIYINRKKFLDEPDTTSLWVEFKDKNTLHGFLDLIGTRWPGSQIIKRPTEIKIGIRP